MLGVGLGLNEPLGEPLEEGSGVGEPAPDGPVPGASVDVDDVDGPGSIDPERGEAVTLGEGDGLCVAGEVVGLGLGLADAEGETDGLGAGSAGQAAGVGSSVVCALAAIGGSSARMRPVVDARAIDAQNVRGLFM